MVAHRDSNRIFPLANRPENSCWHTVASTGAAAGLTEISGLACQPRGRSLVRPARIWPAEASYSASPESFTSRSDTTSVPVDSRDNAPSADVTMLAKLAGAAHRDLS